MQQMSKLSNLENNKKRINNKPMIVYNSTIIKRQNTSAIKLLLNFDKASSSNFLTKRQQKFQTECRKLCRYE